MADDVTARVQFGDNDGECLPLTKCVCGSTYTSWDCILGVEPAHATTMPCCGRTLYFGNRITVYEVTAEKSDE